MGHMDSPECLSRLCMGHFGHNRLRPEYKVLGHTVYSLAEGDLGTVQFAQLEPFTLGCLPTSTRGPWRARPSTESAACTVAASLLLRNPVLCASTRVDTRLWTWY